MSSRVRAVELIRALPPGEGVEIGVWRGERAERILATCPNVTRLTLIDPWCLERNIFPCATPPERMRAFGEYRCLMGERALAQAELDAMYDDVRRRLGDAYGTRCRVLRWPAAGVWPSVVRGSLAFVLVDGIHLEAWVAKTAETWWTRLRPGGLLLGDGAAELAGAVERAIGPVQRDTEDLWWATR